jgi:hypothetical protein
MIGIRSLVPKTAKPMTAASKARRRLRCIGGAFLFSIEEDQQINADERIDDAKDEKGRAGRGPITHLQMPHANNKLVEEEADGESDVKQVQRRHQPARPNLPDDHAQMKHDHGNEHDAQLQHLGPKEGLIPGRCPGSNGTPPGSTR